MSLWGASANAAMAEMKSRLRGDILLDESNQPSDGPGEPVTAPADDQWLADRAERVERRWRGW